MSTKVETFQDLSLPIPSRDHLNVLHQNQNTSTVTSEYEPQGNQEGWVSLNHVSCNIKFVGVILCVMFFFFLDLVDMGLVSIMVLGACCYIA